MIYKKTALTLEQQADLLIHRGLSANRDELIARLKAVNYYRLSGYLHPFRELDATGKPTENFRAGTTLGMVWRRYNFDRRLRMILLDAIERIEVAVRTRLVYHFVAAHGPFGHLDAKNLPGFKKLGWWKLFWLNLKSLTTKRGRVRGEHTMWLGKLKNEKTRAREDFVKHFVKTYGDQHDALPLWMACELMTCESVLQLANSMNPGVLKLAAADFGFPDQQLLRWTKAIFTLRNGCAHHARIWNRVFGVNPTLPPKNKNPLWYQAPSFAPDRVGLMLTVCHFWLGKVSPTTQWRTRLFALFDEYPEIPLSEMGMPDTWRLHPLWR